MHVQVDLQLCKLLVCPYCYCWWWFSYSFTGSRIWHFSSYFGMFWWRRWSACLCHCSSPWHQHRLYSQV